MDIILSPGFGSCLYGEHPRPGTANEDLAEQIATHVAERGREHCILITAVPVTIALNTRDIRPEINVPLIDQGRDCQRTADFLDAALARFAQELARGKFAPTSDFIRYFVAAQRMQRETMLEHLEVLYGVHAKTLSDADVRPDPESVPTFTRSLVRFWFHEKIAGVRGVGRY